jgi:putative RecB family exonuclease
VEPLSGPPIRSYSQLTQLEECGEQYRLKRIERLPEQPAIWFPAGNAFHAVTEVFDGEALDCGLDIAAAFDWGVSFGPAFNAAIRDLIDNKDADPDLSTWRTAGVGPKRPKGDDYDWWLEHGPDMVRAYVNWRVANAKRYGIWVAPDGTPGIEWEGTAELGGVQVTMRADRILVDIATGATIIVDLKSGKTTPDDPLQLRIYRMVIERVTAEPMWYGAFYMARDAALTPPVVLDTTNERAIEERFSRAEQAIQAGVFIPRPGSSCRQCGVKQHCIFVED